MNARITRSLLTAATAFFFAGTAMAQAKSDFNDDGKADLVWRHQTVDSTVVWYMNGATATSSASFPVTGTTNYEVGGVGDVNGDGHPDLILRNKADGGSYTWFTVSGTTLLTGAPLPTVADQNWKISGLGDFNWDGRDEIVWRHYGTGQNAYWTTSGWSTYTGSVALPAMTDVNWYLGGVADFDNNGFPDLVWHHMTTGANILWLMTGTNGTYIGSTKTLASSAAALRPEAVADYTGDGCIDIVMRNVSTGANELWAYDCSINRVSVTPIATVATGWTLSVH